ncbi:MAG TPA: ABC-2 family transporter protein [Caulobacteraceae bacterium]|jgi:ABC-2 type transport system permease protein
MNAISTYAVQSMAALRTSFADRTNFTLQVLGMAVNNGFWLVLWFLFFTGFKQVGGWGLGDVARLLGIVYTLFGTTAVFFGGYRDVAGAILRGEIDPLLTQPKPILPRLLARDSIPSAWGDLATGLLILAVNARLDLGGLGLSLVAIAIGMVAWLSTTVIFSSMAFWFAGARSLSRDLMDFTLMVSTYPSSIYSGWVKIVAFTVLPAGFVAMAPVGLVRAPSLEAAAFAIGGAAAYASVALSVFHLGLRRYRRGG